jgi:predicted AlkP superfamily pyrophosphatase or phosphodiesterase
MWPGSEAHIGDIEPTYVDNYNGKELLSNKVNRILGLLDLPGPTDIGATADAPRPQLIAAYVPNVDAHGHLYGPNSTEIRQDINEVDTMLGDLFQGLEERNLTDIVNIIIVSDHGMASTDTTRLIQLDDIIDMSLVEHVQRTKQISNLFTITSRKKLTSMETSRSTFVIATCLNVTTFHVTSESPLYG